ncbi:MAG: DMT family transporter [Gammaproteobacteria bacterium]|nr:DMT family transporter [Gammaproteobacteria bacterium]
MEPWIAITLVAAFLQNARTALQKKLVGRLDATEASYVRFCYAWPFALAHVALLAAGGADLPVPTARFLAFVSAGAVLQILGTVALIASFAHRNFAVGSAYSKTETVQTALFGLVLLGDAVPLGATLGIGVSLVGVLLLSPRAPKVGGEPRQWVGTGGWLGMGAGAGFASSAVCYRGASLALDGEAHVTAAVTLLASTVIQTLVMGLWLARPGGKPGALPRVASAWRVGIWVGLAGMAASAGWFTAMTLESAALVRALGQVELLFAFVVATAIFRERVRLMEVAGSVLIVGGIGLLLHPALQGP